jgi:mannan endo-1,4-beta-mannosidase
MPLSWVRVAPGGRSFVTEDGEPFLVIGHNEALPWPPLRPLLGRRDLPAVESYLTFLAAQGVTVLRIMLEDCEEAAWFFEDPADRPRPEAVQMWDDLIALCERTGLRLLVVLWDTFHLFLGWSRHPYARPGSGFDGPGSFCVSPSAFEVQTQRVAFFIDRWGGSPAVFGYDLFNELHPAWGGQPGDQYRWVTEMARFVRERELARWGKSHLLTVSSFGGNPFPEYQELVFCHPALDFASTHVYAFGAVDNPQNTIDCALVMRDAVAFGVSRMREPRPYTDTESGPIHRFMDLRETLPEAFDDEYFHNMSWAHLATGGAGGGMRWPFRDPHCLTPEMHAVQRGMSRFLPALDWVRFSPEPWNHRMRVVTRGAADAGADTARLPVLPFGCGDRRQALAWLLRDTRVIGLETVLPAADLILPGLEPGLYVAEFWETYEGLKTGEQRFVVEAREGMICELRLALPQFERDLALTIRRMEV